MLTWNIHIIDTRINAVNITDLKTSIKCKLEANDNNTEQVMRFNYLSIRSLIDTSITEEVPQS